MIIKLLNNDALCIFFIDTNCKWLDYPPH